MNSKQRRIAMQKDGEAQAVDRSQDAVVRPALLLPCPFCGGVDLVVERVEIIGASRVACLTCGGQAHTGLGIGIAIERWNYRSHNPGADRTRHLVTGTVQPFVQPSESDLKKQNNRRKR